jgi:hypothetical protein
MVKFAVNARGCNEATVVSFSSRNPRGITFDPVAQRHIKSCCRHMEIFLTRPECQPSWLVGKGGHQKGSIEYASIFSRSTVACGVGAVFNGFRFLGLSGCGSLASQLAASGPRA